MKIAIRGGHSINCPGASGKIDETREDRKVYPEMIRNLELQGHEVLDCTSNLPTQSQDLAYGVNKANDWGADLFISIHFNKAYRSYNGALGSETWIYMQDSKAKQISNRILSNMEALGFKNRGYKDGYSKGYYEIKNTTMTAIIVEVCFVEATEDVRLYCEHGPNKIASAISSGITGKVSLPPVKNNLEGKTLLKVTGELNCWTENAKVLKRYHKGDLITAVGALPAVIKGAPGWWKLSVNGINGWVSAARTVRR